MIKKLELKSLKLLIAILLIVFSVYVTGVDLLNKITGKEIMGLGTIGMYGSQYGYTIVNFVILYIIGAYIKISNIKMKLNIKWCLGGVGIIILPFLFLILEKRIWEEPYITLEYCNPLIIAEAVFLFCMFNSIKICNSKIISRLASESFSVYLLHTSFLPLFSIFQFVNKGILVLFFHVGITCAIIYAICWLIGRLYHVMTKFLIIYIYEKFDSYVIKTK